jgi:hypothetical protein
MKPTVDTKESDAAKIIVNFLAKQIEDNKLKIVEISARIKDDERHLQELAERWL